MFSEGDENKLEYTQVHEEYIHVIDQAIEAQLLATFTDVEIAAFYDDFKAGFQAYKEKNPDAFEILCCTIDFPKFKEQMLKFKKGAVDVEEVPTGGSAQTETKGEDLFWDLYKEDIGDPKNKWRKALSVKYVKEGFTGAIYQKPNPFPGTSIDLMRFDLDVKNCTRDIWCEVFKFGPPIKNIKCQEVVEEVGPQERIIYLRQQIPIMSDREHLIRWKRIDLENKQTLLILQTVQHKAKPIIKGVVRAQILKIQLLKQDEANPADMKITDFTSMDLKGYFPSRLMNMAIANMISIGILEVAAKVKEVKARN